MAVGCGANISKIILFIVNVLVWLASIALVAIGGYVLNNSESYSSLFGSDTNTLAVVCGTLIGVACFIFLVGFLGCCGACAENSCFLKLYFTFLLVLVLVEIIGGILAFVYKGDIQDVLENSLQDQVKNSYGLPDQDVVTKSIDRIQREDACCGANNYTDYEGSAFYNFTKSPAVPISCCKNEVVAGCNDANTDGTVKNKGLINLKGCNEAVSKFFEDNFIFIGAAALGLVVVEILAMMMACCLISGIGSSGYQSV